MYVLPVLGHILLVCMVGMLTYFQNVSLYEENHEATQANRELFINKAECGYVN